MIERSMVALGAMLLVVPMSFVGISAGDKFIERDEHDHTRIAVSSGEPLEVEVAYTSEPAAKSEQDNHLLRRLFWTLTTMTGAPAAIAYVHAKWTGQEEAYLRYQRALIWSTWEALKGMPESMVAFAVAIPELASTAYEDPSLVLQIGENLIAQAIESAYTFATTDDDEEAARIASSTVADAWFGKLLAGAGVGTRFALKSRWATRAASSLKTLKVPPLLSRTRVRPALAAGFCFVAGTLVHTPDSVRAIEDIDLGARVATSNHETSPSTEVDASWLRVELVVSDARSTDGKVRVAMLRPPEWLERTGAKVGGSIELMLDEMGVHGRARVIAIERAPQIVEGPGRVVLATIESKSSDVRVLHFVGTGETLEPTAGHRLYSLDRRAFVAARELRVGERLRTRDGALTIASIRRRPGTHTVFNLEVEREHEYFVSRNAVLSHNVDPCAAQVPSARGTTSSTRVNLWPKAERAQNIATFKERLASIMTSSKRGPSVFAKRLGVTYYTIFRHRRASFRGAPSSQLLLYIARAEGVSIDWLLGLRSGNQHLQSSAFPPVASRLTPALHAEMRMEAAAAFRARFTALANRADISAEDLAERIGRTQETGRVHASPSSDDVPNLETLVALSKSESVTIDWLLGLSNETPTGITDDIMRQSVRDASVLHPNAASPNAVQMVSRADQLRSEIAPVLRERLEIVIEETRLPRGAFAESLGLNVSYFSQFGGKPTQLASAAALSAVARQRNVSVDWLLGLREARFLEPRRIAGAPSAPVEELFQTRFTELWNRPGVDREGFMQMADMKPRHVESYLSLRVRLPPTEKIIEIARAANVRVDWLLGLID